MLEKVDMKKLFILFVLLLANIISAQSFKYRFLFERETGKGIVDSIGTILLPANAQYISFSEDQNYIAVKNSEDKYGVLDENFDTIIPFKYDYISFGDGNFEVNQNDLSGVLDRNQKVIIPIIYKTLNDFSLPFKGYSYETVDGKFGIMDQKGKFVVKDSPYWLSPISKKVFDAKIDDDHYFVDKKMKKIQNLSFRFSSILSEKYTLFYTNEGNDYFVGLISAKGKVELPAIYDRIDFNEKYQVFIVQKENKYGMLDAKLQTILPFEYDKILSNKNTNRFVVSKNKKHGFVDEKGNVVIDLIYDEAESFSEGLAAVVKSDKWGFIDENGNTVIDFNFVGTMTGFINGYAKFYKGNFTTTGRYTSFRASLINKKGEFLVEPEYEEIEYCFGNKAIATKNGYKYLIDIKTKKILFQLTVDDRIFQIQG